MTAPDFKYVCMPVLSDAVRYAVVLSVALLVFSHVVAQTLNDELFLPPPFYLVGKTSDSLTIDGRADELSWQLAPWMGAFGDIVDHKVNAPFKTMVKMLWDERFLYVYAELQEEDLWATLREHDSSVFQDNAFEIFIDADGDGHQYVEFQINAFATVWDLLMTKPYRDGGFNIGDWDIKGLKKAVDLSGTLNNPADRDTCWRIELAIPMRAIRINPKDEPMEGSMWRMNCSRVQWALEIEKGRYKKKTDSVGNELDPDYTVWSSQGAVSLHMPERWGYVVFANDGSGEYKGKQFVERYVQIERKIWKVYYLQKKYKDMKGYFAGSMDELSRVFPHEGIDEAINVSMMANRFQFWIQYVNEEGNMEMALDQEGRVYYANVSS